MAEVTETTEVVEEKVEKVKKYRKPMQKKKVCAFCVDKSNAIDYKDIDYSSKIALIIGNEGKGMSRLVMDSCDYIAKIPMVGKINSLNASVASGIMIYEVVRNRK